MSTTNAKHERDLTDALEYIAGMDTSRPFQPGDVRGMMLALERQLARVTAQRDELVAAMRWVLRDAAYKAPEQVSDEAMRWIDRLGDALATLRVEGGAE